MIALAALLAAVFAGAAGVPGFSRIHLLAKTIVGSGTGGAGTGGPLPTSLIDRMCSSADPYSPAYDHLYRHGVVPTLVQRQQGLLRYRMHQRALADAERRGH